MSSIISKVGNDLAVLIPLDLAEQLQLKEGTDISITISEGKLIVTPKNRKSYTLDELLEGMTPECFHPETDTGIPVGRGSLVESGYVPERGDIIRLNFSPQLGKEQAGYRPAFIVSPSSYNQMASLALMCPITSKVKRMHFEVPLADTMQTTGVILVDHLKSLDWKARKIQFIEKATPEIIEEVLARLAPLVS